MRLDWLHPLAEQEGPFATVLLDATHATEDAEHADALRWRALREQLATDGADEDTLAALDDAVSRRQEHGPQGRVLVAAGGRVLLDVPVPAQPDPPRARWDALPDLLAVVTAVPEPVSTVVVRIDEQGGEISAPAGDEQVAGSDGPVHKVRGGGLSHRSMQERVEESWRRNTAEVAGRVDKHVAASGARLLVVAGDARSRSRLVDALGERAAAVAVQVEHSGGTGAEEHADAVAMAVDGVRAQDRRSALERFAELDGKPDGLAAQGLATATAGFREHAVSALFVDPDEVAGSVLWAADATELDTGGTELQALGRQPAQVDAGAAVIRAAALTDAELWLVDDELRGELGPLDDGIGVILRHALAH